MPNGPARLPGELLPGLLASLGLHPPGAAAGGEALSLEGIPAGAQPALAAAIVRARPERTLVMVTAGLKAQETALQDLTTWLGREPRFHPDWEVLPHETRLPHADVIAERLDTLVALAAGPQVVVTSVGALLQRSFTPDGLRARVRRLARGHRAEPLDLVEWLEDQGYEPEAQVTQKGALALRGGILDLWPPTAPWPVRLEFFGDELDSLREFDPHTQVSREVLAEVTLPPAGELGLLKRALADAAPEAAAAPVLATFLEHLPGDALFILVEPAELRAHAAAYAEQVPVGDPFYIPWEDFLSAARARGLGLLEVSELAGELAREPGPALPGSDAEPPPASAPSLDRGKMPAAPLQSLDPYRPMGARAPDPAVAEAQRREFFGQLHRWLRQGLALHVFCNNEGERDRFLEVWRELGFAQATSGESKMLGVGDSGTIRHSPFTIHLGTLSRGFLCKSAGLVVVTDAEIFGRYKVQRPRRLKSPHAQATRSLLDIDFTELEEGDLVVHVTHGIARFRGLQTLASTVLRPGDVAQRVASGQECLVLEYAAAREDAPAPRLYVPVTEAHLVSKYVGAGKIRPPLNTLGGARWAKAKKDAEHAVRDLAAELLEIQAARETESGHAFGADTNWQREFEASFLHEETPDQFRAIEAAKRDLEAARPMDRLVCGDVGFGKTEVAIRAAFKAVMGGKQVAILVPTTVLAQQHYNTFRERMSDYPVRVELLSRFRTRREQQQTLEKLAAGEADIVIGTHRLVQADVQFKDLGLVVIDEEQRFGVQHKERFKLLRRTVDVLTLSATPIPRTLYLALSGARDLSTIETPPQDRLPIETVVSPYDERLIRDAVQREMNRQGQVFFLHNRVETIDVVAAKLKALLPHARIVVGHGQMDADELEEVMTRFVNGEADVLLSTTIIESGLDIPNANTIIIDRADRFGLSELYQLRGRVGRYKHQAYAYLLIPRHAQLLTDARRRIAALKQHSSLGSGFKIAMRDLELRGAGNLLGAQQSGHITAVGFDLYCQLLKQSIGALKGEKVAPRIEVTLRLDFLALNPAEEGERKPQAAGHKPQGRDSAAPSSILHPPPSPATARAPAFLPFDYVNDARQRVELYRRLASVTDLGGVKAVKAELRDRFGPLPPAAELLLHTAELKVVAAAAGVTAVETREDRLMLTRNGDFVQFGGKFPRLTKRSVRDRLGEIRRVLQAITAG
ncbi:MAG: transcription-repair coupling factor [Limisphaerales bacterium]